MREARLHVSYIFYALFAVFTLFFSLSAPARRLALAVASPFVSSLRAASGWGRGLLPAGAKRRQRVLDLELRLRELEIELAGYEELRKSNAELRGLLELPRLPGWQVIAAELVSRDPALWSHGFSINKGLAEGVQVGSAVLAGPYLIGRVAESFRHHARVASLLSPECRLSLTVQGMEMLGVSNGASDAWGEANEFRLDYLDKDLELSQGQKLYTSGLGGEVPGGLPVAEIRAGKNKQILQIIDNSRARINCRPLGNLRGCKSVAIIVPKKPEGH
ncbi:MAG: rod shape-determining protein MreC [Lentisphaerae bacterium]|nr:rod shape-determining protein MreC [Lentisphaerota bacterium]